MWDLIKDYMNSFLGVIVIAIGLIAIPEIHRKKRYLLPTVIICIILLWLGIDKVNRDNRIKTKTEQKDSAYQNTITSLNENVKKISSERKEDSISFLNFQKSLEEKFNIIRDSVTNKPIKYETTIGKAENVNIGR